MGDSYSQLAERFLAHYATLRGVVRHTLVDRQLAEYLAEPPARIADIGGGAGHQSIPLARRGYEVMILDPSEEMLSKAQQSLALEEAEVRGRVRLVRGAGEVAAQVLGDERFDAVLCHGVLPYVEEPGPLIHGLGSIARPGGLVSILAKNADALAMRPALEGRYRDALDSLGSDRDQGGLGIVTRGDRVCELSDLLAEAGIEVVRWYGVRVFTDHLGNDLPDSALLRDVVELEWEAGNRDPYRAVARLIHLVGRKLPG